MTFVLFFSVLAVLILSHEFGHFISAKLSGARVEEFGLGFPPKIFSFKKGETVYSLNLVPFGGFVKIFGEDSNEELPRSFSSRPAYARAGILFSGVFFNLLLAWFLLAVIYTVGAPASVADDAEGNITIVAVQPDTPAEEIGLLPGDRILNLSFENKSLSAASIDGVQNFISSHKGKEIKIGYLRGKDILSANVTPAVNPAAGTGALGIAMDKIGIVSSPFYKAVYDSLKDTVFMTGAIARGFIFFVKNLIVGENIAAQVSGPVGIFGLVGAAANFGLAYVVQFAAVFSINLAILNMVPIPALDGGRLLFLAVETVKRKPINQKVVRWANSVSFIALLALMLAITLKDIFGLIHN